MNRALGKNKSSIAENTVNQTLTQEEIYQAQNKAESKQIDIPKQELEKEKSTHAANLNQVIHPYMIDIPGGTFWMGTNDMDDFNKPRHQVIIRDFQLSETEVTNAQYAVFLNLAQPSPTDLEKWIKLSGSSLGEKCRISFKNGQYLVESGYENHPVIYVSWYGAKAY
ncbi:MAG: SUMF1/EgtB/PvdO family nonheme iron enzyme, partial [Bacteroidetes bacterium]|nr:SUMF1/EgtB/PvdO family nonheme iron enzyme [Bacteroidota bacterium]